jgi:hypothetical protein
MVEYVVGVGDGVGVVVVGVGLGTVLVAGAETVGGDAGTAVEGLSFFEVHPDRATAPTVAAAAACSASLEGEVGIRRA